MCVCCDKAAVLSGSKVTPAQIKTTPSNSFTVTHPSRRYCIALHVCPLKGLIMEISVMLRCQLFKNILQYFALGEIGDFP